MYTLNGRTARLAVSAGLCALISMGGAAPSASALNYNEIQGISTWDAATDNSAKGSGTANGGFADGGATEGGSSEGGSTDGSEQTDPGEQAVVQVGDTTYSDLNKALSNAEDGDTIKLLADTSYATGRIDGISVTLDLNGKTLTVDNRAFNIVNSGSLTLDDGSAEGSGLLKVNKVGSTLSLGMVLGSGGSFTMKGGTLEVPEYGAYITNGANGDKIIMSGGKVKADYGLCAVGNGSEHSASIVIEGGLVESSIFGVVTNGGSNVGGVDIVMTNGTVRSTAEDAPAMYLPAFNSTAKISGGVIEGGTGIEIRAGDLTVFGSAQITGTGPLKTEPNGSGSTSSGAGIAIKQHATKQPINVLIEGSPTISGAHAVDESNPQENDEESIAKVSVNINGGSFSSTAEGEPAIFSEDCKNFISGGSFSTKVESNLLSTSVKAELNASGTYTYFDSVDKAVAEAEKTGGEVIQLGEENTVKVTLNYGYSDKTLVLNAVSVTKLPAPSRSGYTFLGWYDGESKVDVVPNTDANLEARWYYNAPIVPPTPSDKTEVEHNQDGSTTTTVTKPDGSQTITHETATGTESVVKKDEDGNVISTEVTVSKKDAESGKVELPLADAEPAVDVDKAPEVEVKVPSSVTAEKPVQVTVPVAKGDGSEPNYGVVVFAVDEDGNEKRHGFIIIAGSGFDAEIMMKAAPTKNDIGEIAYFLSALATPNPTVAHFTIEHDGIVEELDGICCMAGNTSVIQNDINLFPDCRMNDGMVDIAVIEPVRTVQLLPTVITAALDPAGKVLGRPQFKIIQTKEAEITCTPSLDMQFDGEIISSNSGVFGARALPQCLDLIVDEFSPLGK